MTHNSHFLPRAILAAMLKREPAHVVRDERPITASYERRSIAAPAKLSPDEAERCFGVNQGGRL